MQYGFATRRRPHPCSSPDSRHEPCDRGVQRNGGWCTPLPRCPQPQGHQIPNAHPLLSRVTLCPGIMDIVRQFRADSASSHLSSELRLMKSIRYSSYRLVDGFTDTGCLPSSGLEFANILAPLHQARSTGCLPNCRSFIQ